jgi:hypothetical protein
MTNSIATVEECDATEGETSYNGRLQKVTENKFAPVA